MKALVIAVFTGLLFSALLLASRAYADNFRIITPYLGYIKNVYENPDQNLNLDDSSLLKGLYFQWVNTDRYQWNTFIYQSSDINYSTLWGGHFIFDYYLGKREGGKYLIGAGVELICLDMDAGNNISGLSNFQLTNNIFIPYLRVGKYFLFNRDALRLSFLPWAGIQPQWVRGDLSFDIPSPPFAIQEDIKEDDFFALAGFNVKATFFHFLEIQGKYRAAINVADYFSTVSGMMNLYFTLHWGLSYRYKYMENTSGSDSYHIGGPVFVF